MSEPRYDFILAVVRQQVFGGLYKLYEVFLIYAPNLPQGGYERRIWCSDTKNLKEVARVCGGKIFQRLEPTEVGKLHLTGVVPMLEVVSDELTTLLKEKSKGNLLISLSSSGLMNKNLELQTLFLHFCGVLKKRSPNAGNFYVRNIAEPEVPRHLI